MAEHHSDGCFHVPSVPRGLLLPGLDTYEVAEEELPDPTPAGSHVSADRILLARRMVVLLRRHSRPRCGCCDLFFLKNARYPRCITKRISAYISRSRLCVPTPALFPCSRAHTSTPKLALESIQAWAGVHQSSFPSKWRSVLDVRVSSLEPENKQKRAVAKNGYTQKVRGQQPRNVPST